MKAVIKHYQLESKRAIVDWDYLLENEGIYRRYWKDGNEVESSFVLVSVENDTQDSDNTIFIIDTIDNTVEGVNLEDNWSDGEFIRTKGEEFTITIKS